MQPTWSSKAIGAAPAAAPPRGRGLSIFQKLLALTLSLIAVTVTLPAVYLPARQLRELEGLAVVACLLALLVGAVGAYRIARSLSGRLESIARVADAVAHGELEQPTLPEQGKDEISVVSRAFNAMLRQLRDLIAQIRDRAEVEQRRLEGLVAERTRELDARQRDLRYVLDHVGQGFLTLSLDGLMSNERSAILERWLGPVGSTRQFGAYLRQSAPDAAAWFELNWPAVAEGFLPLELTLDQLPKRLRVDHRTLELEYRPIHLESGQLERVLVVISDRTAELERSRAEADERELTRLFTRLLTDRSGFGEFSEEVRSLLESLQTTSDTASLQRCLHTLKGSAAIYGLDSLAGLCQELEDDLCESQRLDPGRLQRLLQRWAELCAKLEPLLDRQRGRIELEVSEYEQTLEALTQERPHAEIRRQLLDWRLEPTQVTLLRLAEYAERLAERQGKGRLTVCIDSGRLRLDPHEWRDFWVAAVHLVRNCVDHGLETPAERSELGKPIPARLELRTALRDGRFSIEVVDDGRGIDWPQVAERAVSESLPVATEMDLAEALFAPGLSTRKTVTELSGRGIGLSIVKDACDRLGGSIDVHSQPGRGTTFRFSWPASRIEPRGGTSPGSQISAARGASSASAATSQVPNKETLRYASQGR